jgi:hypothetical protein
VNIPWLKAGRWCAYLFAFSVSLLLVPTMLTAYLRASLACERDSAYLRKSFSLAPYGWICTDGTSERTWTITIYLVLVVCLIVLLSFAGRLSLSAGVVTLLLISGLVLGAFLPLLFF